MLNTHHCELTISTDFILSKPAENYYYSSFQKFLHKWCTINKNHPKCKEYLISLARLNAEKRRHESLKNWWIIHPFSKLRYFSVL